MSAWSNNKSGTIIFAACLVVFVLICNPYLTFASSRGLDGKWETQVSVGGCNYNAILEFSGKNLTITDYFHIILSSPWRRGLTKGLSFNHPGWDFSLFFEDMGDGSLMEKKPYEILNMLEFADVLEIITSDTTKDPFTWVYRSLTKGTFSITDHEIEIVFPDGYIGVHPFSRTENTIKVGEYRFIRIIGSIINDSNDEASSDGTKRTAAVVQIREIETALDMYRLHNGFYPSTEQGLKALVTKPVTYPQPKKYVEGAYLKKVPLDPWGNPFVYRNPGNKGSIDIISCGPSGKEGVGYNITSHDK